MTTGNKIRMIRQQKGMTLDDLAKLIGTTRQTISKYERDLIDMPNTKLIQIANALRVAPSYLMDLEDDSDNPLGNDITDLPSLGEVAGGIPIDAIEDRCLKFSITDALAKTGQYCTFDIKGDSMAPKINDGDTVLVRYQPMVSSGDVAILYMYDYQTTCKKVFIHEDGSVKIVAYNEAVYAPKTYTARELEEINFKILGKVILVVRDRF